MAVIYSEAAQRYSDQAFQGRAKVCISEQAQTFVNDADASNAGLARGILGGNTVDEDAIIRLTVVQDTGGDIDTDDAALLGAVQTAWPLVASARYPQVNVGTPPIFRAVGG